jgi:prophage maintenance system killer protein
MAFYGQADLALQASALCYGIFASHAFVDGNKRAAWFVCVTFLLSNGRDLPGPETLALTNYLLELYEQEDHSNIVEQIAAWLRERVIDLVS